MDMPLYVKHEIVFDCDVLYPGRAVRLGGYDETGEPRKGIWLVQRCDYDRLVLINHRGNTQTIHLAEVLDNDENFRTTITPLEG